jgi:hypothetical protein
MDVCHGASWEFAVIAWHGAARSARRERQRRSIIQPRVVSFRRNGILRRAPCDERATGVGASESAVTNAGLGGYRCDAIPLHKLNAFRLNSLPRLTSRPFAFCQPTISPPDDPPFPRPLRPCRNDFRADGDSAEGGDGGGVAGGEDAGQRGEGTRGGGAAEGRLSPHHQCQPSHVDAGSGAADSGQGAGAGDDRPGCEYLLRVTGDYRGFAKSFLRSGEAAVRRSERLCRAAELSVP